jgi:hypothetical protein
VSRREWVTSEQVKVQIRGETLESDRKGGGKKEDREKK